MKRIISILLLFVSFGAFAQTYDALPTGSKPYGNQLYITPAGLIVGGTGSAKFRVLGTKKYVDSLLALKQDVSAMSAYATKTGTETLTNKTLTAPVINTPDITNGAANSLTLVNGTINATPIGASIPSTGNFSTVNAAASSTLQLISQKGQNNGYASLDGSGKIPVSQMPDALVGAVVYQGNYNASNNTPALPVATGNKGKYYVISAAGTQQGLNFENGDWIISNGTIWQKVDNSSKVASVNGMTGAVTITDITGNAGSATNWGGVTADFTSYGSNIGDFWGYDATAGKGRAYTPIQVKSALATSLQDVTSVGGITNNAIKISGANNLSTGEGLEIFYTSSEGNIQSYDRGGTNTTKGLNFTASKFNFIEGNVGVGTTLPTQKLDVNGYTRSVNGFVGSTDLNLFADNASVSAGIILKNDNNVLIGTTTNDGVNKLQVNGNAKISGLAGSGDRAVFADASGLLKIGDLTGYAKISGGNSFTGNQSIYEGDVKLFNELGTNTISLTTETGVGTFNALKSNGTPSASTDVMRLTDMSSYVKTQGNTSASALNIGTASGSAQDVNLIRGGVVMAGFSNTGMSTAFPINVTGGSSVTAASIISSSGGASNVTLNNSGQGVFKSTATKTITVDPDLQRIQAVNGQITNLVFTPATATRTVTVQDGTGTLAFTSDITNAVASKANTNGGNTFGGVQMFTNGSVQPLAGFSDSGYINTLQSDQLTTNVTSYLPRYGGVLAAVPTIGGTAPTPTGTGIKGQVIITGGYRYECTATNTWVRSAIETTW